MKKFNHKKLNPKDLTFEYDHFGYQLVYKGIRIGGAGTDKKGKKTEKNLQFQKEQAQIAKRDILTHGKCHDFMKTNIVDIDNGKLEWLREQQNG